MSGLQILDIVIYNYSYSSWLYVLFVQDNNSDIPMYETDFLSSGDFDADDDDWTMIDFWYSDDFFLQSYIFIIVNYLWIYGSFIF